MPPECPTENHNHQTAPSDAKTIIGVSLASNITYDITVT